MYSKLYTHNYNLLVIITYIYISLFFICLYILLQNSVWMGEI